MKKEVLIIAGAVLVLALTLAIGIYLYMAMRAAPPTPGTQGSSNPFGTFGTTVSSKTFSLVLSDGSVTNSLDFTRENQPDWAGPDVGYQVAGSETQDFQIIFYPADYAGGQAEFLVTLYKEPLGSTRRVAEQALRAKLGIPDSELCGLASSVSAGPGVSSTYEGISLGLSFCPDAVQLP